MRLKSARRLESQGSIFQTTSDTEVIAHLIARSTKDFVSAAKEALQRIIGGFAFLIMTNDKLLVASDPHGLRPLVMGRLTMAMYLLPRPARLKRLARNMSVTCSQARCLYWIVTGMTEDRFAEA